MAEAGLARCDDGELRIIDGASHRLHIEQPERINAKILGFPSLPEKDAGQGSQTP
ncbi:alpha/beta fold hydrolase [Pararoseomonas indoligenes]|uniref:Alpha/beta hydrolase n=1 Tax=Roseomonas indoligenes TaxID=2820811 RepID=A0A940N1Y1_9PROT|nr:alpha/beta hydrolase [Pararoseomonas indoligenes]MBP0493730.1 alpha/beta hydrolase [Pararoseomonas indoligenes]